MHKISVLSMVTKLQDKRCFVNKQLTYNTNLIAALRDCMPQNEWDLLSKFPELYEKIFHGFWEISNSVSAGQSFFSFIYLIKVYLYRKKTIVWQSITTLFLGLGRATFFLARVGFGLAFFENFVNSLSFG